MTDLKKDLALAAAQVKAQSELSKNPSLNVAEAVAEYFIVACKFFDTERGKEFLTAAQNALGD